MLITPPNSAFSDLMAQDKKSDIESSLYSGWHLGHTQHEVATTEFEWAILRFEQAFERFVLQIGSLSGLRDLNFSELVILHVIHMQNQPKTAALIARQLNMDGVTNVQYALRKLLKYNLIQKVKGGRSKLHVYEATAAGAAMLEKYTRIRRLMLTDQTRRIEDIDGKLSESSHLISMLTGVYDEACRISSTFSPSFLDEAEARKKPPR